MLKGSLTKQESRTPAMRPYAAPKTIATYIEPGKENVCTLQISDEGRFQRTWNIQEICDHAA